MAPKKSSIMLAELKPIQRPIINFFNANNLSVLIGEAGTGKDFTCLFYAIEQLVQKNYEGIVITKPVVEVGKGMGFLPGMESEKIAPYKKSFDDIITKLLGPSESKKYLPKIKFEAVDFCRGNTFESQIVILSEAQNLTLHELMTFTTRFSDSSKMIINGDTLQADIKNSGLAKFIELMSDVEGLGVLELGPEHQMRHPIIVELNKRYREYLKTKK